MNISILQHTPDTPPSFTTTWLEQNKMSYRLVKAFNGDAIPKIEEVDWLIVLGGGMNIDDEENYPFLRDEKKLVEQVLKAEKSYLGLCLGGQMLARVMGAEVRKHSDWEVGWHQVQLDNEKIGLPSRPLKEELHVFQWHQDTFDIPSGAVPFARNSITANQGFVTANGTAIGTQFHPEADEAWVKECATDDDLPAGGLFVQTPEEMISGIKYLPNQISWYSDLLKHLAARTKARVYS